MDISNLGGAEYETRSVMNAPAGDSEAPAKTSYYFPPGRLHKFSVVKLYNNIIHFCTLVSYIKEFKTLVRRQIPLNNYIK